MNIYKELNKVIEYIEMNLEEKLDYKELAKMIGVNEYTFQRIFSVIFDISVTEYIRNRRLSNAGQELVLKNEKIIDMALRYQYENATSFSRAFERFHGIKPSEVKKNAEKLKMFTKIHPIEISEQIKNIEYQIIRKEKMVLYGICKETENEKIKEDAPKFFEKVKKQYGKPEYGMVEYKDKERYFVKSYWVLYSEKKENFTKKVIEENKWIMFRIKSQEAGQIQNAVDLFYKDFLPSSKYIFKDLPELEYYHDDITDFLIPIED